MNDMGRGIICDSGGSWGINAAGRGANSTVAIKVNDSMVGGRCIVPSLFPCLGLNIAIIVCLPLAQRGFCPYLCVQK